MEYHPMTMPGANQILDILVNRIGDEWLFDLT